MSNTAEPPAKQQLLEEALSIVTGPRQQLYGRPSQNFIDTAKLITAYLQARGLLGEGQRLEAYDTAVLVDLLKTARIATSPFHKDNWVDKAGYAACGWEAASELAAEEQEEDMTARPWSQEADAMMERDLGWLDQSLEGWTLGEVLKQVGGKAE